MIVKTIPAACINFHLPPQLFSHVPQPADIGVALVEVPIRRVVS